MFNVGIDEIIVVLFVCLVVFGPERLLGVARQAGRLTGQLRLLTRGVLGQPGRSLPDLGWARCTRKPASAPRRVARWMLVCRPVTPVGEQAMRG